ncbi:MAG TPA: DUF3857 domain-containing protein [Candidatus Sulfotelmatobacter sp.]|nr:DUF3857 domain-containing protein [Candidatus Sulfotelmatobacter sp.]
MASEPKAPGAMAIYLYRQLDRDDIENREFHFDRIKIFSEEGRKYADIEIPFFKGAGNIKNIQARTIHPDGTIVNFDGKVYEKTVVKAKGVKFLAKTFSMADVQAGSIIEYRYTRILPIGFVYDSQWLLSEELFTKHAKFSLHPNQRYALQWSWPRGLPAGTGPPLMDHHVVRLETQDIPAFQIEDYMPPADEMKYRVDFRYTRNTEKDPDKFWKQQAQFLWQGVDFFTNRPKAMEQAVAQIVAPEDTPERKLEKIYARCQKIRNVSFERERTEQENDREKLKDIQTVEDVWKRGYGNGKEITWLFFALARAAGFEAIPVMIATRNQHFFDARLMNPDRLNTNVVLVKLAGKDIYLDPGVAFASFGFLPWDETGVAGRILDKDGGAWVEIPLPDASLSGTRRVASLHLDENGVVEGRVTITYKGISALERRIDENQEDDEARRKFLDDELKSYVPLPIEVKLTNKPDWDSSSPELVAEFHFKVDGWASTAGRRTFMPAVLFGGGEKHLFERESRVHPVDFQFSYTDEDEVTVTPSAGLQISNLPQPRNVDVKACLYSLTTEKKDESLLIKRRLMVNLHMVDAKYYVSLRNFFQAVRTGDEQQIVLSSGAQ